MNMLEQGKIPGHQLTFLLASFLFGTTVIILPGTEAGHDTWIAVIIGFAEGLIFALLYISLARRYPGRTLIEINKTVFGSILGKLVSLCYLWYFLQLGSLVLRNFGDFFITTIYPETPMLVVLIMLVLLCASAVRNGIEVISKCSLILLPIYFLTTLLTFILLLPKMDFYNFLPLFDKPLPVILWAGHTLATFPFGETVTFLMVLAYLQKPNQGKTSYISAFTLALIFFLIVTIRNIAVLGPTAAIELYPSYRAVRLVNIAEIITRLEVLIAVNFLFLGFLKLSVLYYATALGLAQLLQLRSYLPLVLPLGSLLISLSILQFENNLENIFFATKIYPFYSLLFELFLPGLTLLVSLLRKQSSKA